MIQNCVIDLEIFFFSSDGYWEEDEWQAARHLVAILWPGEPVRWPWSRKNKNDDDKNPAPFTEKDQQPIISTNASNDPFSWGTRIQSVDMQSPVELSATQIDL